MQSSNGIDIAAVYQLLTEMAQTVRSHSQRFDRIEARLDVHDQRFTTIDRTLGEVTADIAGLREAVTNYHASVLGHSLHRIESPYLFRHGRA